MCPSAGSEVEPYASRGARTVPGGVPPVREGPTRQGQCDSRLDDLSEEVTLLGQCPRPIPTRRGVPGNRGVSQLEGKAEPTCQPPGRGEARGRSDGSSRKPRYGRSPEVASTAMPGTERGGLPCS